MLGSLNMRSKHSYLNLNPSTGLVWRWCPCRARVRTDDGDHSEWFDVTRGLRQVCVLSTLLLNVFFSSAIHAVPVPISEDEDIVRDLVHLEDDVVVLTEVPLACVRRALRGMLYANERSNCFEVGGGTC